MLVVAASLIAVMSPLLAWRWPAGLVENRWRWPWLIWATLAFQALVLEVSMPVALAAALHVVTYAIAGAFVWFNRRVAGLLVVGTGAASNGIVIALNGGTLPASAAAVEASGIDHNLAFANSAVLDSPVLPWLGDVFAWPAPMPLANTFSVGDLLIVVGIALVAWTKSRRIGAQSSVAGASGAGESDAGASGAGASGAGTSGA